MRGAIAGDVVPRAVVAFRAAAAFEDAVRGAISLGGDADVPACIARGIAEASCGGVPVAIEAEVRSRLDPRGLQVVDRFRDRHRSPAHG